MDCELSVHDTVPPGYAELAWDTFFASRGRGLSLDRHFPALLQPAQGQWFVIATCGQAVVGGVFVSEQSCGTAGSLGTVGLVCVASPYRGRGISTALLRRAIGHARDRRVGALRLWTGKHDVYAGHGFRIADDALFGWVEQAAAPEGLTPPSGTAGEWPDAQEAQHGRRGLPPYAQSGQRWASQQATLVTVNDGAGPIVAEWTGDDPSVIAVMQAALPPRFRLNARRQDSLIASLTERGWRCDLAACNLQMILPLDGGLDASQWAALSSARVLDRI